MKPWLLSKTFFWEEAPFFRLLLPFIIAIICYDLNIFPALDQQRVFVILIVIAFSLTAILLLKKNATLYSIIKILLIHCNIFLLGWLLCYVSDIKNDPLWFGKKLNNAGGFIAIAKEAPQEKERTRKLKVELVKTVDQNKIKTVSGSALLYIYKNENALNLKSGDTLLLPNKWIAIKNPGNPHEFDYAKFCARNNLYYQQFIGANEISIIPTKENNTSSYIQKTHDWGMRVLSNYLKDTATLGMMQAMLLGDEINFDDELRQSYTETGIIHIVAISGSHVLVFFWFITTLLFWLRGRHHLLIKYIIALPLVWFYVLIAGAPTSAVRAVVMFSLIAFGFAVQKNKNPLNQLFAAAFIMLLFEPLWLFSLGFQLSFCAVLSLILFYKSIYKWYTPSSKTVKFLWQGIAASIAAEVLIAPIIIYYFHLLPATFLVANLIAYLFMSIVLIAGMILILLSWLPFIPVVIAAIITLIVKAFNGFIHFLQQFNPVSFKHLYLSLPQLLLVYFIIICVTAFLIKKHNKVLIVGLSALCVLMIFFIYDEWNALHQKKFIAYNINRASYAEIVQGKYFTSVTNEVSDDFEKKKKYAVNENHIVMHAWKEQTDSSSKEIISIGKQKILVLDQPLRIDSSMFQFVDFVLINYPLKEFTAVELKRIFGFKKLIITGNQKRYLMENWKDSCLKHNIDAHFTMFDGAFVLNK